MTNGALRSQAQHPRYTLRQKLDFTQWGNAAQFWNFTTKHHKALLWWGADTQNRRLVPAGIVCAAAFLGCFGVLGSDRLRIWVRGSGKKRGGGGRHLEHV